MAEITFDGNDPAVTEARMADEARLAELGDKLIAEEDDRNRAKYEQARKDEESELRYAGKFKSAEDLEKAYKELESKLGKKEEASPEDNDETPAEESVDNQPVEDLSDTAQFIQEASSEYFSNNNQLKPDTIQKLKELPSEQLIDAYMELQKDATIQQQTLTDTDANQILSSIGGEDVYNEALGWAVDNLKPDEVAAFDNVINSGNKDAIFFAANALVQRYQNDVGFEGKRVSGKSIKSQSAKAFRSQAELARAISDPRYRNDPAYRLDIQDRLAASGDLL
jgi:hypothetical protein